MSSEAKAKTYTHQPAWDSGFLQRGNIHKIHYEQYGKQDGKPVVFLHGGPGGSTSIANTIFFDPSVYRVVLFDQRGSGRSEPVAETRENTSHHLVSDIEALREHLGIPKWSMVFGGSWGSTLALLYAQTHPDKVGSLVLRGIFTFRKSELEFTRGVNGAAHLFPEAFEQMVNFLPPEERDDFAASYHRRLTSDDLQTRLEASRAYNTWEMSISMLVVGPQHMAKVNDDRWSLQHAIMEDHYEVHGAWLEEGQLLMDENIKRIERIPCTIVQGRYDIVCPPKTAWDLHKKLPSSKLYWIPTAGHDANEPGIRDKLTEVCDEHRTLNL